jgi:SAM-dependent methyltransferase
LDTSLAIPDAAVKYILFQRTAYIQLPIARIDGLVRRLFRNSLPAPVYNLGIALESRLSRRRTKTLYAEDMVREYQSLCQVLPRACSAVLDIGCGVAGIDVFIQRHYARQPIEFFLLDRSEIASSVFYSFQSRAAFYNSLEVAREMLTMNGVPDERIHLLEATAENEIKVNRKIDLVISLLSWGFHYPIETYLLRVHQLLSDDGVLALDVRKGSEGLKALRAVFPHVEIIQSTAKYDRVAARKR